MTTLFERVLSNSEDGNDKISIHLIQSLMVELAAGRIAFPEVVAVMGLNESQSVDFARVLTAGQSASNGALFAQRVFAHLLLAENSHRAANHWLDGYLVEENFWSMIDAEAVR